MTFSLCFWILMLVWLVFGIGLPNRSTHHEENERVQVAVHSWDSQNTPPIPLPQDELEVHPVIYCTVTWLTYVNT